MNFRWIFFLPVLLLTACLGDSVRERSLAGLDLSNMALVQELGRGLSAADRATFSTYVAVHAPSSRTFCGERLFGRDGREPQTVGEAIDMTNLREFEIRLAREEQAKPMTPAQQARFEIRFNDDQRGRASDQQTLLFAKYGPAALKTAEWAALERRKAAYAQQVAALREKTEPGV